MTAAFKASQGVETLEANTIVAAKDGTDYQYIGTPNAQVDLSTTDFTNTQNWTRLASAGDVYRYVGSGATLDINNQNYPNTALWVVATTPVQAGSPSPRPKARMRKTPR